jgi:hypothetical protein
MAAWRINRIHRWLGIAAGAFIFLWAMTGIVMILPGSPDAGPAPGPRASEVFAGAGVAPAAIIANLAHTSADTELQAISLRALGAQPVYVFETSRGSQLFDARSGAPVVIDSSRARELALAGYPGRPVARVSRLEGHDAQYPDGPLPVFRVVFGDADGTVVHVSSQGTLTAGLGRLVQVRRFISGLHVFRPVRTLTGSEGARHTLLHLISVLTMAVVLTGYWMVLPPGPRPESSGKPPAGS